ncbi:2OG-Fe(II) oxygenase [Streptomyces sp. DSM 44915]|uniref:2OG-Fe(II) oxygenase n=1 Tax=Streptomyces chisholmiae TaxID=3075540 RepID=A0ABU2JR47_9ACTN|nr:2OG-Fe(II) oxygenase [Streptomyces sp. DSM 44915]MDT0267446.1 2OG-Fe(II) oxygenase [Streptomyces sp. DSM 44915]
MQITERGERYTVIDDFLDDAELAELRRVMEHSKFSPALNSATSVLTPEDGAAYRGRRTVVRSGASDQTANGDPAAYGRIVRTITAEDAMFGTAQRDWNKLGFTFWNYPAGSRLGWHSDAGGGRQGSYILFLHDEWRASWGGETLVLDEDATHPRDGRDPKDVEAWVREADRDLVAVLPRPNRLLLLQAGTPHQVNRVDPTAALVRRSLTGHVWKKAEESGAAARDSLRRFLGALEGAAGERAPHGTS